MVRGIYTPDDNAWITHPILTKALLKLEISTDVQPYFQKTWWIVWNVNETKWNYLFWWSVLITLMTSQNYWPIQNHAENQSKKIKLGSNLCDFIKAAHNATHMPVYTANSVCASVWEVGECRHGGYPPILDSAVSTSSTWRCPTGTKLYLGQGNERASQWRRLCLPRPALTHCQITHAGWWNIMFTKASLYICHMYSEWTCSPLWGERGAGQFWCSLPIKLHTAEPWAMSHWRTWDLYTTPWLCHAGQEHAHQ